MANKKKTGSRPLTPDERGLWEQVTRADRPLPEKIKNRAANKPKIPVKRNNELPLPTAPKFRGKMPDLAPGAYSGIDRNTQERFRKGKYAIDGRLDLHGLTREKARLALIDFIHVHWRKESRFLLVITGKGTHKQSDEEPKRAVLREALPGWLAEDDVRPYILAYDSAQPKHGGSGAYYILLRRQR